MFTVKIRAIIAAAAATVVVSAMGAAAPTANAAIGSMSASLTVKANYLYWDAESVGYVSMTQAEAGALLAKGAWVVSRVWGEDAVSDDLMTRPELCLQVMSSPRGLEFRCVDGRRSFNEDDCCGDYGDEIYAGIRLVTSWKRVNAQVREGPTIRSVRTNVVEGYFPHRGG